MICAEAIKLSRQLGHTVKTVKAFEELFEKLNLQLAIVNATSAWVVVDSAKK